MHIFMRLSFSVSYAVLRILSFSVLLTLFLPSVNITTSIFQKNRHVGFQGENDQFPSFFIL